MYWSKRLDANVSAPAATVSFVGAALVASGEVMVVIRAPGGIAVALGTRAQCFA